MTDNPNFPTHFALATESSAGETAPSAAAKSIAHAGGAVVPYPMPHHIDARRGAGPEDIELMSEQVAQAMRRLKNSIFGDFALYRACVERIIENQAENVPIGRGARVESFTCVLLPIIEELDKALTDLNSDVQGDIERALKDFA